MKQNAFTLLIAICLVHCAAAQNCGPLHVMPGATGAGTGQSWQDAFVHLQDALDAAVPGDQIWVAAGAYLPQKDTTGHADPTNERTKTFVINKEIQIYGGFAGTELELSQRNPQTHLSVLSGDLGTTGVATDNAYHVLWITALSTSCIIDGFTITRGNANGAGVNSQGGGILLRHEPLQYARLILRNCIIEHNHATSGGGFYTATESWAGPSIRVENCTFRDNTASSGGGIYFIQSMVENTGLELIEVEFSGQSIGQYGGGLYANGHIKASDCRFENNSSNRGAGVNVDGGTAKFENCAFVGNTSQRNGGGMRIETATVTLINCLFQGNEANILNESSTTSNAGGGLFYRGSNTTFVKLTNCVFSGNKGQNGAGFGQTSALFSTSSAELDNCTFAGNNGVSAVARLQGNLTIENSIIFGNGGTSLTGGTARSSIIEGGYAGAGNTNVNPMFVVLPSFLLAPIATGNLTLQPGSPAIDQGDNSLAPLHIITDAGNSHRMINCVVDRGAFEFGSPGSSDRICYADADGDLLGNGAMPRLVCGTCPNGFVPVSGDCDDADSAVANTLPPPTVAQLSADFCRGEPQADLRTISAESPGELIWVLVQAPSGSRFDGQEPLTFYNGDVNAEFSVGAENITMCSTPSHQNATVNGVWVFETYYETSTGCRSAIHQGFSIRVRQADTIELSAAACNSYTLNGHTYTQSGIYTQMLPNAEGCDSIIVIDLVIGQADTIELSAAACNSYTLNGHTYTQSGIYTQMLPNAEGCDSIFILHLEIVSPPVLQFDLLHPSCTNSGNGQATASVVQGTSPFTYLWSDGQTTPVATGLTSGEYTVTLTDSNGCTVVDTIALAPQYQMFSAFTILENPVCHGDSAAAVSASPLGGVAPFTYQWEHGPQTAALSGLPGGTYRLTITDANGCTATGATIFTDPPLLEISVGASPASCATGNDGTVFSEIRGGMAPYTFLWSTGSTDETAGGLTAGTYFVTATDQLGCAVSAEVEVELEAFLPELSIVQNNHILTSQEVGVEYQWIHCNTGLPIQNAVNQSFEAVESGRYAVVLSRGLCRDTSLCMEVMLVSTTQQGSALLNTEAYPNPNNGMFVLRMPVSGRIALYDATGRLLRTEVRGAGEHTIFIDGPAGLYWLNVMYKQAVQTLRIIRQ